MVEVFSLLNYKHGFNLMRLTKKYIKDLLGNTIYYRALNYYREGRVKKIQMSEDGSFLLGEVKGSGRNTYEVEIEFEEYGEIREAFCGCPYPYLCKHIGAVLLEYLEWHEKNPEKTNGKTGISIENPFKNDTEKEDFNELIIDLKDTGEVEHPIFRKLELLNSSLNLDTIAPTSSSMRKGFRLIFVIEKNFPHYYGSGYSIRNTNWIIRPALQYIKRDGEAGRIERYNASKITYPISEVELTLLSIIERHDENKAPFEYLIDYFLPENKSLVNMKVDFDSIPAKSEKSIEENMDKDVHNGNQVPLLYIKREKRYEKLSFSEICKINLKFNFFSLMINRNNEPVFKPLAEFIDNDNEVTSIKDHHFLGVSSKVFFVVDEVNRKIFYKTDRPFGHHALVENLLKIDNGFTYSDIKRLEGIIDKRYSDSINVHFPAKKVRILNLRPKTILSLRGVYNGLEVGLMFKYSFVDGKLDDDKNKTEGEGLKASDDGAIQSTGKPISRRKAFTRVIPSNLESDILILNEKEEGDTEEIVITWRDKNYEDTISSYIRELFDEDTDYTSRYLGRRYFSWQEKNPDNDPLLISLNIDQFLIKYGEKLLSEGFELRKDGKKIATASKVTFTANWGIDWFDIKTELQSDDGAVFDFNPDTDVIDGSFLRSKNSYILLDKRHIEKIKSLYQHGTVQKDSVRISKYDISIIEELYQDIKNRDEKNIKKIKKIIDGLKKFDGIKNVKPPETFSGKLRDYQQAGLNWLYFLNKYGLNGILADDMGLGKTIQALALILTLKDQKRFKRALIVAPVSTLSNWINEIERFAPSISTFLYHGPSRQQQIDNIESADVTVTSYGTLRNDIEQLLNYSFTYLILDESQMVKNPLSKSYKSVRIINAENRLSLTGTPVENSTTDLWAQMNFLNPGLLGTLPDFKRRFSKAIEKDHDTSKSELLKKIIFPFILRRKKEDVLKELPPKEEIILYATMDKKQRQIYEKIRHFYKNKVSQKIEKNGLNKSSMIIFEALLKLRQAAILPSLISKNYEHIPSCKLDLLKLKIDEVLSENHKALIFSQFRGSLSRIREWIKGLNVGYTYLDGSTRNREDVIRAFQEEDDKKIFIISLKAGGLGINLTASNYVFLFDPWWNPAVEMQAVDRSHRIGQMNKVTIYKLITKDTIEEKILMLQDKKRNLVKDIISTEKAFFKSLSKEEIMSLFDNSSA